MGWQLFGDRENGEVAPPEPARTQDSDELFWASPVGRATRARLRGDRFFQIELDDATLAAYAEAGPGEGGGRRARRAGDLLGQIEELGWRLEHVSWWRVDAGEPVADDGPPGQHPDPEHVRGVYLFHCLPDAEADAEAPSTSGTHRRDVL